MDFVPLIRLALTSQKLTSEQQRGFQREMRRLRRYISSQTRSWWPVQLRPDDHDLEDLSNTVLVKILDRYRASGETMEVASGYMFRVVQSVLSDFLTYQCRRLSMVPMPPTEEGAVGAHWASFQAELDRYKSNLRIAATRVLEEVRERLDMRSALGREQYQLLAAVLLCAIEDPFSDERDVYVAAQRQINGASPLPSLERERAPQRLRESPALGTFMRERARQSAQFGRRAELPRWGKGIRALAWKASDSSSGSMASMGHPAVDDQRTAGSIDELSLGLPDDDTTS